MIVTKIAKVLGVCVFLLGLLMFFVSGVIALQQTDGTAGETISNEIDTIKIDKNKARVEDELIVKFKENTSSDKGKLGIMGVNKQTQIVKETNKYGEKIGLDRIYILKVDADKLEKTKEQLEKDSNIEYVEYNDILEVSMIPNDFYFNNLWGLDNELYGYDIDAPQAWDITTGSSEVVVAVIDSGIDYNHEDLKDNIKINENEIYGNGIDDDSNGFIDDYYGWDFYNKDNNPMDDTSHGTHCAGIIASVGNNNLGVIGVAPNVRVLPIKFLGPAGTGPTSAAILSINYAILRDVDIISNSWNSERYSFGLRDAINAAENSGILFVASAGNNNVNTDVTPDYPSSYNNENIISVGSIDRYGGKSSFSNYGLVSVDIAAPGTSIYSTVLNNQYATKSGTSMAAPYVAGVAALIKSQNSSLGPIEIKKYIMDSAIPISSFEGKSVSGGLVNAYQALIKLANETNIAPIVNAGEDFSVSNPKDYNEMNVLLNGSVTDSDGTVTTAIWYENGEEICDGTICTTMLVKGVHEITLIATDNLGKQGSDSILVTVLENQVPVAIAKSSSVEIFEGEYVKFDASESYDLDGIIESYEWDTGDMGGVYSSDNPDYEYQYNTPGEYNATLTITDDGNKTSVFIISIKVKPKPVEITITKNHVTSSWNKKTNTQDYKIKLDFEINNGNSDNLIIYEIPENRQNWSLNSDSVDVKIKGRGKYTAPIIIEDNKFKIDLSGINFDIGDRVSISGIEISSNIKEKVEFNVQIYDSGFLVVEN